MSEIRGSALLFTGDPRVKAAVAEAGYVPQIAGVCSIEVPCLRDETYGLVVTDETTDRDASAYLRGLCGSRRRAIFVVAVSARGPSGDRFTAWSESADLVVRPEDLPNLRRLVGDGLREKQEFYRRFEEARRGARARLGAHV
jgi:hypothetical protein